MKHILTMLDKSFENRIRLGIMSLLVVNDWMDFTGLKETLEVTDGNLASHLTHLEKKEYIEIKKEFVARKPQTSYAATVLGKKAFNEHLDALEKILKNRE